ncbi:MAG: hypothetical protein NTX50_19725 [Candidatus Sumerlaeota bacterium]|nr:hypothetical protein [Candidatus Sumerlaeota bacterium]
MTTNRVVICLLAFLIVSTYALTGDSERVPVFTTEKQILAVSREDQSNAIKIKMIKREVLLTEVISVLTTYSKVTRHQYMIYDHQIGVSGTVSLTDGKSCKWMIEPGYAATVKSADGVEVYLLRPDLRIELSSANDAVTSAPKK